jgi:hypothetical protein
MKVAGHINDVLHFKIITAMVGVLTNRDIKAPGRATGNGDLPTPYTLK